MRYEETPRPTGGHALIAARWELSSDGEMPPPDAGTILPDGSTEIAIVLDGVVRTTRGDRPLRRFVLGPSDKPRRLVYATAIAIAGVRLRPAAAGRVFGGSASRLVDRVASVGAIAPRLDRRLAGINTRPRSELFGLLEDAVASAAEAPRARTPAVEAAIEVMVARRGRVRVDALARQLGFSERHLERTLAAELGLTPKRYCRVLRFQAAVEGMEQQQRPGWAEFASALGYADQAHFSREFRAFAGASPSDAWWARP